MNCATVSIIGSVCLLTLIMVGVVGGPVYFKAQPKPPNCPYGKCFIDRCIRICSCIPPEGNISCTNNLIKTPVHECDQPEKQDNNCPHGQTFRSRHWTENFVCYCNNDASQTYECIDTLLQQPAKPRDLFPETYKMITNEMLDEESDSGLVTQAQMKGFNV